MIDTNNKNENLIQARAPKKSKKNRKQIIKIYLIIFTFGFIFGWFLTTYTIYDNEMIGLAHLSFWRLLLPF